MAFRSNRVSHKTIVLPPTPAIGSITTYSRVATAGTDTTSTTIAANNSSESVPLYTSGKNHTQQHRGIAVGPTYGAANHQGGGSFAFSPRTTRPHFVTLDNFEPLLLQAAGPDGILSGRIDITSPRSLTVCASMGIDPSELMPLSTQYFERTLAAAITHNALGQQVRVEPSALDRRALAQQRFDHYDTRRQEKLRLLRTAREQIISNELRVVPIEVSIEHNDRSPARDLSRVKNGGDHLLEERDAYLRERQDRRRNVESRRAEVQDRAAAIGKLQQEYMLTKQINKEQTHQMQFRQRMLERQQNQEFLRMQNEKMRENVERARRQQSFHDEQTRATLTQNSFKHRDPAATFGDGQNAFLTKEVQKYRIHAAKLQYLTPRQRESLPRKSTTAATPR